MLFHPHHLTPWEVFRYTPLVIGGGLFSFIGKIIGAIAGIVGVVGKSLESIVGWIVKSALPAIIATVKALGSLVGRGFSWFGRAVRHIFVDIIHGRFKELVDEYEKLRRKLRNVYRRYFGWWDKFRMGLNKWFFKPQLELINLLQRFRRVLSAFRIFHLKWAETLDREVARLEGKIITNDLRLARKLNEVGNILNLVLDPALLWRRVPLVGSIITAFNDILGGLFGTNLDALLGASSGNPLGTHVSIGTSWSFWTDQVQTNSGDVANLREAYKPALDRLRQQVGQGGGA